MDTPYKKTIFLIGANSNFIQDLIKENDLTASYDKIIYVSHRPYKYKLRNKKECLLNFISRDEFYKKLSATISNENIVDILFSNTPTSLNNMNDETYDWSIFPIEFMENINNYKNINRCIYLGSTLSLVPVIRNSTYKRIKKYEFEKYVKLREKLESKVCYFLLPPIDTNINGIGYLFKEEKSYWIHEVIKSFDTRTKTIIPEGLNGILVKILLLFKRIKL